MTADNRPRGDIVMVCQDCDCDRVLGGCQDCRAAQAAAGMSPHGLRPVADGLAAGDAAMTTLAPAQLGGDRPVTGKPSGYQPTYDLTGNPTGGSSVRRPDIPSAALGWRSTDDRVSGLHQRILELEAMLAARDETIRGDAGRMMTMGATIADLERRLVEAVGLVERMDAMLAECRAEIVRLRSPTDPVPNGWLPPVPGLAR